MASLLPVSDESVESFDTSASTIKAAKVPQDGVFWQDYNKLTADQQAQSEEAPFSDGTSTTDESASEGSDIESDDEGSVRSRPLSDTREYTSFIPQSLSLPQGLGIHSDDCDDLSEPEEIPSVSTSRRGSVSTRSGPSHRIASSVSLKCFSTATSSDPISTASQQYVPRSAPAGRRQSAAMSAAIREWHTRHDRLDSDSSDESEAESIRDRGPDGDHHRVGGGGVGSIGNIALTIDLEQDSSDEEGSASSCSSGEGGQQTAERSAASRRLFATLNNREGKTEADNGNDHQSRSQHQLFSPPLRALSYRRANRTLPSLQQIQSRVASGAGSALLHSRPKFRTGSSSPGGLPTYHTPVPVHQRVTSCPTPSLSGKWWQFGQVAVVITPPTPCPQPNSPMVGYVLHNAGNPVHAIKFHRSKDDLDLLAPPPFELAPGRQQMAEERDKERASAQELMRQSQEQIMAALAAMRLASERENNSLGRRGSVKKNGSGQVIGLGWPGSPGTPLPHIAGTSMDGSGSPLTADGLLTIPAAMMMGAPPPPLPVPSSAPATIHSTPSRIVDFAPHSLPRRPTPASASAVMTSYGRRGRSPARGPSSVTGDGGRPAGKYVPPPARRNSRQYTPSASLPHRPLVEGPARSSQGAVQSAERVNAGRNLLNCLDKRRSGMNQ